MPAEGVILITEAGDDGPGQPVVIERDLVLVRTSIAVERARGQFEINALGLVVHEPALAGIRVNAGLVE